MLKKSPGLDDVWLPQISENNIPWSVCPSFRFWWAEFRDQAKAGCLGKEEGQGVAHLRSRPIESARKKLPLRARCWAFRI